MAGRFLIRWREGERAHAIKTHANISAIVESIKHDENERVSGVLPRTTNSPSISRYVGETNTTA